MSTMTKRRWLAIVAGKHQTHPRYVVPETSYTARGFKKTGRRVVARLVSPWEGRYLVFDQDTARDRTERGVK